MSEKPYDFIETEDEQNNGVTADEVETVNLEELYPNYPDGPPPELSIEESKTSIEDIDIDADELAEELDEGFEADSHTTEVGSCVVNSDSSPTLIERIVGFLKGLVR